MRTVQFTITTSSTTPSKLFWFSFHLMGPVTSRLTMAILLAETTGATTTAQIHSAVLASAYGSRPGDAKWNPSADLDGNGVVGLSDLVILTNHYGQHIP